jgi:hypothetical protein
MTDEHEQQEQTETEGEQALPDLDVNADEAEQVKGGARSADPCEGGE